MICLVISKVPSLICVFPSKAGGGHHMKTHLDNVRLGCTVTSGAAPLGSERLATTTNQYPSPRRRRRRGPRSISALQRRARQKSSDTPAVTTGGEPPVNVAVLPKVLPSKFSIYK